MIEVKIMRKHVSVDENDQETVTYEYMWTNRYSLHTFAEYVRQLQAPWPGAKLVADGPDLTVYESKVNRYECRVGNIKAEDKKDE